jgi:prepilin-type N-terminal cleavage/methylation domain-containing protein
MKKGFTLPEVLIAIFILIVGVVEILVIFSKIFFSSQISVLEFTASYLASEGIEIVRNIRDENLINLRDWDEGINQGDWRVEYDKNYLLAYSDEFLKLDENGFYNYTEGEKTPFKRKITIKKEEGPAIFITSEVTYHFRGMDHTVAVEEYLYRWVY